MRRALVSLFLLSLLLPAATHAQGSRFEITPFAGYRLGSDFDTGDDDLFDGENVEVDESEVFGVIVEIPVGMGFQIELLANRQQSEFVGSSGLFTPGAGLGEVDLTMLHGGVLFEWGGGQVKPFFVTTIGVTRIDPEDSRLSSDDRLSFSFGGGAKIMFADHAGLRLEGRGFWTDLGSFDDDDRHHHHDDSEGLFQAEASVGLIIAF
jgi:hypothetical protein